MTKQAVLDKLRGKLKPYGQQKEAASALGVSPQYLSDVLSGKRDPGPAILKALGLRRAITYTEEK